jgi:hypothetical protein
MRRLNTASIAACAWRGRLDPRSPGSFRPLMSTALSGCFPGKNLAQEQVGKAESLSCCGRSGASAEAVPGERR